MGVVRTIIKYGLIVGAFFISGAKGWGQSYPTERQWSSPALWMTVGGEKVIDSTQQVVVELSTRSFTPYSHFSAFPASLFHLQAAYQRSLTKRWRIGGKSRWRQRVMNTTWHNGVFIVHEGKIASLTLLKEAHYEWVYWKERPTQSYGRFIGSMAAQKSFLWRDKPMMHELKAELFIHHKDQYATYRKIDQARLGYTLYYDLPKVRLGVSLATNNRYSFALGSIRPVYDEEGNIALGENGEELYEEIPDRNINAIQPYVGVSMQWNL
ncbi:hypothetical protein GCM10023331_26620 [Algivirga pacifica]|uniref:DUF3575 domain-containing protein n=2 Tax=Algivirga pacifica TaxID=1162670 RepID=A0ABP9DD40_9BACT